MKKESQFQTKLRKELEDLFPGCIILKNDANLRQGFPDLIILYQNYWAVLECKRSLHESYQPNQEYYIQVCDDMSFASMICPENKEVILNELQLAFSSGRSTRLPKRK